MSIRKITNFENQVSGGTCRANRDPRDLYIDRALSSMYLEEQAAEANAPLNVEQAQPIGLREELIRGPFVIFPNELGQN